MSLSLLVQKPSKQAIALTVVTKDSLPKWLDDQSDAVKNWFKTCGFTGKPETHVMIPNHEGQLSRVVAGAHNPVSLWDLASLPGLLKEGSYVLEGIKGAEDESKLALGWLLGSYRFDAYKEVKSPTATLCVSNKVDIKAIQDKAETILLARKLISLPAEDMGPAELAEAATGIAKSHGAKITHIVGDQLLKKNYTAIYMVGRGSYREPRLIDMAWGNPKHPLVTLVGKGVCFDTGGLDLKPAAAMHGMNKDMGGAAVALALADLIMRRKLKIRLRVIIGTAENAIDGASFRPSDIIKMRNGKTVEVGNTDAEGRLVMADLLTEASKEKPDLLIDFSTLTGSARAAVGTEISALFSNDDKLAQQLVQVGQKEEDFIWQLPLHTGYESMLDSAFADMTSCPNSPYAGAITAALFLQRFVETGTPWVHTDFMGWNKSKKAGRPEGGEAMCLRAFYAFLEKRYATK